MIVVEDMAVATNEAATTEEIITEAVITLAVRIMEIKDMEVKYMEIKAIRAATTTRITDSSREEGIVVEEAEDKTLGEEAEVTNKIKVGDKYPPITC